MATSQMKRVARSESPNPPTSATSGFCRIRAVSTEKDYKHFLLLFVRENMRVDEAAQSCALTMLSVPGENIFEPGPGT